MLPKLIETDRLVLRLFTSQDAQSIYEYASDPEVTRYMDWPTHQSIHTSEEWIEHSLEGWEQESSYSWGITCRKEPEKVVGSIGCSEMSFKISFGYVLNRSYWGQGIATEASRSLVDLLSQTKGVKRVWATCDCENIASAKVLEKAGCKLEGTLHNWLIRPNLPGAPARDNYVFAKSIDDQKNHA